MASGLSQKVIVLFRLKAEATAAVCLVVACTAVVTVHTQSAAQRTVWDGIYTTEQAERGRTAYVQSCAACHADDLRGKSTAPSLVEESFAFQWGDMPVGELLERTRKLMPLDRPGGLSAQTYRDIVAFLLQSNGFPAGQQELESDPDTLRTIPITMKRP